MHTSIDYLVGLTDDQRPVEEIKAELLRHNRECVKVKDEHKAHGHRIVNELKGEYLREYIRIGESMIELAAHGIPPWQQRA